MVISKPGAKKLLSATTAPYLRTQGLTTKLDEFAKVVDLDVPTILHEQLHDPVLIIVRSWAQRGISPDLKALEIRQYKGQLRYCKGLDRLLLEKHGRRFCYNDRSNTLDEKNLRIRLPLSLFLACFRMGLYYERRGHMEASKMYANAERFCYWPGMFDWICASTNECLAYQNNKSKPKHFNEVSFEEWQDDTASFCAKKLTIKTSPSTE